MPFIFSNLHGEQHLDSTFNLLGRIGTPGKNARGVAAHCSLTPINTTISRSPFLGALHFIASGSNQTFQVLQKSSIAPPTWRDKL